MEATEGQKFSAAITWAAYPHRRICLNLRTSALICALFYPRRRLPLAIPHAQASFVIRHLIRCQSRQIRCHPQYSAVIRSKKIFLILTADSGQSEHTPPADSSLSSLPSVPIRHCLDLPQSSPRLIALNRGCSRLFALTTPNSCDFFSGAYSRFFQSGLAIHPSIYRGLPQNGIHSSQFQS